MKDPIILPKTQGNCHELIEMVREIKGIKIIEEKDFYEVIFPENHSKKKRRFFSK